MDIYLEHHGVLGMKWGVRRYQDKSGKRIKDFKKTASDMRELINDPDASDYFDSNREFKKYISDMKKYESDSIEKAKAWQKVSDSMNRMSVKEAKAAYNKARKEIDGVVNKATRKQEQREQQTQRNRQIEDQVNRRIDQKLSKISPKK